MDQIPRLVIDGRRLEARRTGVGRYLETLLRDWSRTGWPLEETILVLQEPEGRDLVPDDPGLRVVVVGNGWPGLAWEWLGLTRVLRRGDILFAPTNLAPRTWAGTTVLVAFDTLLEAVPEGFSRSTRWRFRGRYRSSARRAARVIVPSRSTGRDVVRYYGVDPSLVRCVHPSIGDEFRPRGPEDPIVRHARSELGIGRANYLLFVGKRSSRRNIGAIVWGFARHRRRYPETLLVFVGPDGGEPVPEGEPGVIVGGHVTDEVLLGLLAGATACLYPSEYEGFGLPVVEAMASGCPVITLRNSALVESGGDAAIYLDRATPEAIARALDRLVADDAYRSERVRLALDQASRFRGGRFGGQVRDLIREVAGLAPLPTRG